ncbi:hypothetical protein ALC53_00767 [Atta colombica]|uniref:Ionotropic receptor 75a N-terminal domain-containing protein n=1 Tax=Atta colombica TaxID=520822 RepID=A0A195BUQ4_9HYME|nr:hypothetical protein ALC53_00767 [Atta colombica]
MRHGSWKLLFLSRLLLVSYANDNIMARDYFLYKDVSNVVGFSCGGLESNVKFARTFNEVFVLTSMCNLESMNESSMHILRKLLQNNYRNLGIYVDARCEGHNYTVIYYEATKSFLFDETHKWLILGRKLDDTLSLLNDDSFGVVTDITIAIETDTGFDLYDVYNPCKARGGSLNVTVLGYWTEKSGVAIRLKQSKYERRFNLHGMKLRVGVLLPRKFYNLSTEVIVLNQDMKAKYGRSQFLYTILLHMADLFNFTMEIVEVDPRKRQDNSAPMFVAFQKKTVDISASPIVMKADRLRSGDIIGPVWPMRSCFLFRTIASANMKTKQFLKPLNIKVWYVVLCTIIISASILVILIRQEGIHSVSEGYNICILLTIGALSKLSTFTGSVFVPVHYAGRIAFIHIMLFSVLILNYYSASIVSDRLKNMGVKMNDSLISLADSQLKVAAEPTPYIRSFLQRYPFIQNIKLLFLLHWRISYFIFLLTSKYRMYDYSYHWLVLGSKLNSSVPLLNDSAYSMTTDVTLAITNGSGYDLYDVYNHCKYRGGTLNLTRLGWWRRAEGLIITLTQPLVERRANMHGMTLKISGVIQYRPKNMRLEDYMIDINTRSLDSMHKFVYAMISHTADLFNFSVHASEIIYWDRHSVHGLIFEILQTNYIDFGSNPRIMVSERLDYATLIGAAWPIRPCFMLLSTPSNKIKLEIFFKPFAVQIWYLSAVFIVFFMFIMRIIMKCEEASKEEKYSDAVVVTIGITAQQGANFYPECISGRIALLQILMFNWIMFNYYSGSVVSARLSEPLDMMEDDVTVLADSNLKIAAEAVPYLNYFLYKLSSESNYFRKKRWDPLPESKRYLPIEEGMKQVSEGILAYHTDPNTAYPYIEKMFDPNKICALTEIHLFKQSVMGMLSKMFNTGLRDRQIKYWSSRKPQCTLDTLSTRSISIYETAPALVLLAFGVLIGGIICFIENMINYRFMREEMPRPLNNDDAEATASTSKHNLSE